jgi:hypothetical protein
MGGFRRKKDRGGKPKYMSTEKNPGKSPDPLGKLLQNWRINNTLPPRFQERVWKRIESADSRPVRSGAFEWIRGLFARPAFAAVCGALLLFGGLVMGLIRGDKDVARMDRELAQRYVASVNPYTNVD